MMLLKRNASATVLIMSVAATVSPSTKLSAAESLALEEVIVTARKRAESLQSAPMAVSALSGDSLRDAAITNLADVTEIVPNLQITRPSRDANIYIRGVGPARGATDVTELSVGVYLDEVFLLKPQGQLMDLAEIESIQVLRGPQGTLFGKNTTGGAMLVSTVKPEDTFGGYGQVTVGNDGRLNLQGSIDVPVTDNLLSKLTITSVEADGIGHDPVHGTELSNEDRLGVLAQLRWFASDNVTADFSFFHNRIRENLYAEGDCVVTNTNAQIPGSQLITPLTGLDLITDYCERASDGVATYFDGDLDYEMDASQASTHVLWDMSDDHSVKSITAWRYQKAPGITFNNQFAGFPRKYDVLDMGESTQLSQELQLIGSFLDGALRYTTGIYFMKDNSDTGRVATVYGQNGIWGSIAPPIPTGLVAVQSAYEEYGQENDNEIYSVFTQWSWDATENLELTLGLRYGYEDRTVKSRRHRSVAPWDAYADVPGAIVIPGLVALMSYDVFFNTAASALPLELEAEPERLAGSQTYESFTPMFSAAYTVPESLLSDSVNNLLLYASYTEGYKAGGLSDFSTGKLIPFEEENIDSVEVGIKLDAWDNRLRVNAAVFSMNYEDMQLFVARPDPDPNNVEALLGVTNAGAASIDGFELEIQLVPAADWLINFSASLTDGKFEEFNDYMTDPATGLNVPVDRSDEDLPSLPKTTYSLGIQRDWHTSFGEWTARLDASYRDKLYWGFDGLTWDLPIARNASTTDSVTLLNARTNWSVNDQLSIAVWGKNLSDKKY
jgi:iron complex outermembrane receptor protein